MSQPTTSTLQRLLDLKLGGKLAERVAELRADGLGFRLAARQITKETGVTVTGESLRNWYGSAEEQAS